MKKRPIRGQMLSVTSSFETLGVLYHNRINLIIHINLTVVHRINTDMCKHFRCPQQLLHSCRSQLLLHDWPVRVAAAGGAVARRTVGQSDQKCKETSESNV